jgi:NAD(P)H-dependent FMN reductase
MPDGAAKLKLHVITASTREGRKGPAVAAWFLEQALRHGRFAIESVDLADVNLPLLDEPKHPRFRDYQHEHTRAWSAIVDRADAFVVVTPEYDYGPPASLINALQYLQQEWSYKPMGFVSYGGVSGGTRSVQMTKLVVTSLKMMPIFEAVSIPFFGQHLDPATGVFAPGKVQEDAAVAMLDELMRWAVALKPMRRTQP